MRKTLFLTLILWTTLFIANAQSACDTTFVRVKTANGTIEGFELMGIRFFRGVPYAQPPVGDLRWKEPQPLQSWSGVKKTIQFGPRAMQLPVFSDMRFRSNGMSEDCLYLNIWTPAKNEGERYPVLVYFYGGGFIAGDGSEYRYDGESMARKGIVTVTVNYRLGIFGFFNHPELTKESAHKASGNYGLLDQSAALRWVKENIEQFGGDPSRITIAGESAGSYSVSAQMATPLSRDMLAGAICESGSLLGFRQMPTLNEAEARGVEFARKIGKKNLKELRSLSSDELLQISGRRDLPSFGVVVDGYFLPENPIAIFEKGEQAHVPLLAGWNSMEGHYSAVLGKAEPTIANFEKAIREKYPDFADGLLRVYRPASDKEVPIVASEFAGDMFISFGTWNLSDMHASTVAKPVYRYYFTHPRPGYKGQPQNVDPLYRGASHSAEIEYVLGNLPVNDVYDFQSEDYLVSSLAQTFFANFILTGNPNGAGVPDWNPVRAGKPAEVMILDTKSCLQTEQHRDRYLYLRSIQNSFNP
ncbi:MAG: para-nitrobenzyl esterase [Bacteroidota bacterium]|jgi:para-nitrobenzyl esterase|nr:carboxylesterase [Methermicoccus sp.]MDN5297063.1 para-nitrobenzyl esterase [Bacteroidota bacterium]